MKIKTVGFIGLGLIGGSLAKSIRRAQPDMTLIGYNRSRASLVAALEDGTLNQALDAIGDGFAGCDVIFLCAPVEVNIQCMKQLKDIVRPDCLLTDVGSVKSPIHRAVRELGLSCQFIGGHPMAGSERVGYANASDHLLENAYFILTPTEDSPEDMLNSYRELAESIGTLPVVMAPEEHDRVTAAISHLPHVIAYALVNCVRRADTKDGMMRKLAAGGFKDITRIASSSPDMWEQICRENRGAILDILRSYEDALKKMEQAIAGGDGAYLHREFEEARRYRGDMPQSYRGSLPRSCDINVDLYDEPGAISVVLAILGGSRINVQNLEIMNNRESQDGVLRISLRDEETAEQAMKVLQRRSYHVYRQE